MRVEFRHRLLPKPLGRHPLLAEIEFVVAYTPIERAQLNPNWWAEEVLAPALPLVLDGRWGARRLNLGFSTMNIQTGNGAVTRIGVGGRADFRSQVAVPNLQQYLNLVDLFRAFKALAIKGHFLFLAENGPLSSTTAQDESEEAVCTPPASGPGLLAPYRRVRKMA